MSLEKIRQVKSGKAFKIGDILIYAVLLTAVIAVFLAVYFTRGASPLSGIRISFGGETVYEYDFGSGEERLDARYVAKLDGDTDTINVKITTDYGYNTVRINNGGRVKVTSADGGKLDWVYSGELKDNGGVIYCSPHRLKIEPYGYDIDNCDIIM